MIEIRDSNIELSKRFDQFKQSKITNNVEERERESINRAKFERGYLIVSSS